MIHACARAPREGQDGTWITPAVERAYGGLHDLGIAHSAEAWIGQELVGGLYGVALGRCFFGESMFAARPDASKVALASLVRELIERDFQLIDCQMKTNHLISMGAREISRATFQGLLAGLVDVPSDPRPWGPAPLSRKPDGTTS